MIMIQGRTINNYHNRLVLNALENCSLPIFCHLVFTEIRFFSRFIFFNDLTVAVDGGATQAPRRLTLPTA